MANNFKPKKNPNKGFSQPPNQGRAATTTSDYEHAKVKYLQEGKVEKIPSEDKDIVNKKYVDDSIDDVDLSGLVPYTGATANVNLGSNDLSAGEMSGTSWEIRPPFVGTKVTITRVNNGMNINFGGYIIGNEEDLQLTGSDDTITATSTTGVNHFDLTGLGLISTSNLDIDTININGNVISDSTGTISFNDENLTTTGDISAGSVYTDNLGDVGGVGITLQDNIILNGNRIQFNNGLEFYQNSGGFLFVDTGLGGDIATLALSGIDFYSNDVTTTGDISATDLNPTGDLTIKNNQNIFIGEGGTHEENLNYTSKIYSDGTDTYLKMESDSAFFGNNPRIKFSTYYAELLNYPVIGFPDSNNVGVMNKYLYVLDVDGNGSGTVFVPKNKTSLSTFLLLEYDGANDKGVIRVSNTDQNLSIYTSDGDVLIEDDLVIPSDTNKLFLGAGKDASIYYDGTDLIIDPAEVGSGKLDVLGTLQTDGYNSQDGSSGITATITTAKLTSEGSNGSMTFKNGLLTAQTPAT